MPQNQTRLLILAGMVGAIVVVGLICTGGVGVLILRSRSSGPDDVAKAFVQTAIVDNNPLKAQEHVAIDQWGAIQDGLNMYLGTIRQQFSNVKPVSVEILPIDIPRETFQVSIAITITREGILTEQEGAALCGVAFGTELLTKHRELVPGVYGLMNLPMSDFIMSQHTELVCQQMAQSHQVELMASLDVLIPKRTLTATDSAQVIVEKRDSKWKIVGFPIDDLKLQETVVFGNGQSPRDPTFATKVFETWKPIYLATFPEAGAPLSATEQALKEYSGQGVFGPQFVPRPGAERQEIPGDFPGEQLED